MWQSTKEVYIIIMKKRLLVSVLAGVMTAAVLSGCSLKGDETAITIGDTEIKRMWQIFMQDTHRHSMRHIIRHTWGKTCGTLRPVKE